YRLGRCKGACLGKEAKIKYNFKFINAFSKHNFKQWPFKKPILIEEKDEVEKIREAFLVDKWCYLGSIKQKDDINLQDLERNLKFDLDIYKILSRFIRKPGNYTLKEVSLQAPLISSNKNLGKYREVDLLTLKPQT